MNAIRCNRIRCSTRSIFYALCVCMSIYIVKYTDIYLHIGHGSHLTYDSRAFGLLHRFTASPLAQSLNKSALLRDWKQTVPHVTDEDREFNTYLEDFEKYCNNATTSRSRGSGRNSSNGLCPCVSPFLIGRRVPNVPSLHALTWDDVDARVLGDVTEGHWSPAGTLCQPRSRVAIVVPYRDREKDLRAQLVTLYPILQRQLLEFKIFVIEQVWPALYNKGAMLNIGFLEAEKRWPDHDCVLFLDVDLIMEDDRNIIHCRADRPMHFGAYLDRSNYKLKYKTIVGGALAFTPSMFKELNGYTTWYFGWGGEDDNMKNRINQNNLTLGRPNLVARYTHIKNLIRGDPSNPVDDYRRKIRDRNTENVMSSTHGVDSVKYSVLKENINSHFVWISVRLKVIGMETYFNRITYIYGPSASNCSTDLLTIDVSFTTCKYMCDERKDCEGFSLNPAVDMHCKLKAECSHTALPDTGVVANVTFYKKYRKIKESDETSDIIANYSHISPRGGQLTPAIEKKS